MKAPTTLASSKTATLEQRLSLDTPLDHWIHRPPARLVARVLSKTPVHPNHVTLFTLVPASAAAYCFAQSDFMYGLAALGLFYLWALLDHADGELARITNRLSNFGRKLDDACDRIASAVILCGIFLGVSRAASLGHYKLWALLFAGAAVSSNIFEALLLKVKRKIRKNVIESSQATSEFIFRQKTLDHFTGREPLYLLIFLVLAALYWRGPWAVSVTAVFIAGSYAVSLLCLFTWIRMSLQLKSIRE
jgi:phosphatidylglycerophosphate synthase